MRTTVNLPDALVADAKARAAAEGVSFTDFIEQALRDRLRNELPMVTIGALPTFGAPDRPGFLIDVDEHDALWDALDKGT